MAQTTLLAPITKLLKQVSERGLKGTVLQLYTTGELKIGALKGTDKFGNKYYENLDLPYGQHRWVEFSNIHNPDAAMIQPDWHGWMHHVFDETPDEMRAKEAAGHAIFDVEEAVLGGGSNAAAKITTFVGLNEDKTGHLPTHTHTQYRSRGYGVGSLMTEAGDKDLFYKQPGHILYEGDSKNGRFDTLKGFESWSPEDEVKKPAKK